MPQKTISLPNEVYFKLKDLRRENETFADLLLRLMNKEKEKDSLGIELFFGAFEEESDKWEEIEEKIYSARNKSKTREALKLDS